jgi:beta-lactamase superfamily II metal-dependent hydrolase
MFRVTMLPADEGDSFFIETGAPPDTHRILIDGGRLRTARDVLGPFIRHLQERPGRPEVDLVVLTHIDLDHIEGLLSLLNAADPPSIGGIWFNDYPQLRTAAAKKPLPTARPRSANRARLNVLGVAQAKLVGEAIARNKWPLNAEFSGGPVMVEAAGKLPTIDLPSGAVLTLLGPPRAKLAAFEPEWKKELAKLQRKRTETLGKRARPVPGEVSVEQIALLEDEPDKGKPNGTSITFMLEYNERRALFLADAHPDDAAESIARLRVDGRRLPFDLVKVSHHGSARNSTSQLIDALESPRWLISSNGSHHRHPDPEAISRIILAPAANKELIFNYRSNFNVAWDSAPLSERYGYRVVYASVEQPFSVDLMVGA